MVYPTRSDADAIVVYILAIIFAMGFAILLAQAVVLPLAILTIVFFLLGLGLKSEKLLVISLILFIATIIAIVIGFVFGGTELGRMAVKFFNSTMNIAESYPLPW